MLADHLQRSEKNHNLHYRWLDKNGMPVWINCRGKVIDDKDGIPHYLVGCINEIGNIQRADNVSGLLGEREMRSYISSHIKNSSSEFLIHIGINGFNAINGTLGVEYGNYVLKSVADCINECLSDSQQLYHIVADEYMIIDLESRTRDDVLLLQKEICKKIAVFSLKQAKVMEGNGVYFFEKKDYELLNKIVELVHSIDIRICIEGVEKEEWYQKLKKIQVDYLQGYLFGRPCEKKSIFKPVYI